MKLATGSRIMHHARRTGLGLFSLALCFPLPSAAAESPGIQVEETPDNVLIKTDALEATVRKTGYVSGVRAGTLLDKKTGAHDIGFGLHIMDFLLAPGWRDDGYSRER